MKKYMGWGGGYWAGLVLGDPPVRPYKGNTGQFANCPYEFYRQLTTDNHLTPWVLWVLIGLRLDHLV